MNLRPLGDRVVVKPVEREEKTKNNFVFQTRHDHSVLRRNLDARE